jgi:GNAT superfamily N-acetyltransferase
MGLMICEPSREWPVEPPVEFITVQDLVADESLSRTVWDLVSGQFRTRGKFLAIWPGVRHVVIHRDPVGSVDGFLLVTEPVNWQLDYVVVREDARGRGIASALVCGALNEAHRRRVPYVLLNCDAALRPLYESCGFRMADTPAPSEPT